ncbi:hypothetical protein PV325_009636 [Microctonus aethiopoides]|nr:hypothetical protein PV325_009636 [Microctonus aethiopoides]
MALSIKNKSVLITGGANGIGYSCVHQLLLKGAKTVAILDMDSVAGEKAIQKFNTEFGRSCTFFISTNVSKAEEFESNFKKAVEKMGGLDIMINNAGIANDRDWDLMININIKALIQGTFMAIDLMGKHKGGKGGTVINMASVMAFAANEKNPVYAATKHAVIGFTRGVALNYETTGVAIKAMCPDVTDTSLITNIKCVEWINHDKAFNDIVNTPRQRPEIMGKEIMRLIEEGTNGAIWSNSLETSTISLNIPHFTTWGTPI